MSKLPDKPSDLIELALTDLEKCESDPYYEIDMGSWHHPEDGKCLVCLAGAVMAQSLGDNPKKVSSLARWRVRDEVTARKLSALDYFRSGGIAGGLREMRIRHPIGFPATFKPSSYSINATKFKADLRNLAAQFREAGL